MPKIMNGRVNKKSNMEPKQIKQISIEDADQEESKQNAEF